MKQQIKNKYIEDLLKKIISINGFQNIMFLNSYVDSILREENAINYKSMLYDRIFEIKIYDDVSKDNLSIRDHKESFSDIEHKRNKKKKRFGK